MTEIPHDTATEEALIGRMLTDPRAIGAVAAAVSAADFYTPALGTTFDLLVEAWSTEQPHDPVSFVAAHSDVISHEYMPRIVAIAPAGHGQLVNRLVSLRVRRDLLRSAEEIRLAALDYTTDPLDARDRAVQSVGSVQTPMEPVSDLWRMDDFLDDPDSDEPWLIENLFKVGWRGLLIAQAGSGKSMVSRQVATAASAGRDPFFTGKEIEPVTTLIVDLENPRGSIRDSCDRMRRAAGDSWNPDRSFLWPRPGGLNIRNRGDRSKLEAAIAECRPQFVAIGPLYKLYSASGRESDEQAAAEAQAILDDLRTRYQFALLIEHHGSKGQLQARDLLPHGSSLWLRWPELGIKLMPHENPHGEAHKTKLDVGRFRPDRVPTRWPDRIDRGMHWPWVGEWDEPYWTGGDVGPGF